MKFAPYKCLEPSDCKSKRPGLVMCGDCSRIAITATITPVTMAVPMPSDKERAEKRSKQAAEHITEYNKTPEAAARSSEHMKQLHQNPEFRKIIKARAIARNTNPEMRAKMEAAKRKKRDDRDCDIIERTLVQVRTDIEKLTKKAEGLEYALSILRQANVE